MSHHRRSPRALGIAVGDLRDRVAPDTPLAEIQRAWPVAVGAAIAAEALPTAERAGTVTISCSAAVWAQELDLMSVEILGRLNELVRTAPVQRLRCVTARA
jgi:predicted nucleic acid-binding Zn ribbon protein